MVNIKNEARILIYFQDDTFPWRIFAGQIGDSCWWGCGANRGRRCCKKTEVVIKNSDMTGRSADILDELLRSLHVKWDQNDGYKDKRFLFQVQT